MYSPPATDQKFAPGFRVPKIHASAARNANIVGVWMKL
jgi:hypothetical protein